ncbi:MAG: hypothetical protein R6U19_09610 [Bacteroidales bacterium]
MNNKLLYHIAAIAMVLMTSSCIKQEQYPDEPHIEFEQFDKTNNDSTGIVTISFTDGNGNIGLSASDTVDPYTGEYFYNFFLHIFKKTNGNYDSVQTDFPYHGRIPELENVTEGESIEGDIDIEIDIYSMDVFIPVDTLVFDIYIVDRDLNHSNTIRTPPIILNSF